jgi:hypothetical protein
MRLYSPRLFCGWVDGRAGHSRLATPGPSPVKKVGVIALHRVWICTIAPEYLAGPVCQHAAARAEGWSPSAR